MSSIPEIVLKICDHVSNCIFLLLYSDEMTNFKARILDMNRRCFSCNI